MRGELTRGMEDAAKARDYEKAAAIRDRIRAISKIEAGQTVNAETIDEADVFALASEGGKACVQVFFFRAGQNWGNRAYFPITTAPTPTRISSKVSSRNSTTTRRRPSSCSSAMNCREAISSPKP